MDWNFDLLNLFPNHIASGFFKTFYLLCAFAAVVAIFGIRSRFALAVLWIIVPVITVLAIILFWLNVTGLSLLFALIAGIATFMFTSRKVLFFCPEATAYLAINIFSGKPFLIKPGAHTVWPWDKVSDSNKFVLTPEVVKEKNKGETRDGGIFDVEVSAWYKPDARSAASLLIYNSLGDPATAKKKIEDNLKARMGSAIIQALKESTLMDVLESSLPLKNLIISDLIGNPTLPTTEIEKKFGIDIDQVIVGDITPDERTAAITRLMAKVQMFGISAKKLAEVTGQTMEQALDIILQGDPDAKRYGFSGKSPIFAGLGGLGGHPIPQQDLPQDGGMNHGG